VPLGGDADIGRSTQHAIPTAAANKPEGPGAEHAETAPAGSRRPTADEGASVNAYADRTLTSNERLISLAGYDMRAVTTSDSASSDETKLIDRHATTSCGHRHTRTVSCGGQTHRRAVECSGYSG
jgi:hypothetical protein